MSDDPAVDPRSYFPPDELVLKHCAVSACDELRARLLDRNAMLEREPVQKFYPALKKLDDIGMSGVEIGGNTDRVAISGNKVLDEDQRAEVRQALMTLLPWRKGPFDFHGIDLDAEWNSALKWKRLEPHLGSLHQKTVLDIGCNNAYYLMKLLHHGPAYALGIDPVPRFYLQYRALTTGLQHSGLDFQLLGIEDLDCFDNSFDLVLCLGILYHHPDPIAQLRSIHRCLKKKGRLIVEVQGIGGEGDEALFPKKTYAKAPGVWFLPTRQCLESWVRRSGFRDVEIIDSRPTTLEEQRNTDWCPRPYETLKDFLNPNDHEKTIEGYPAPWRHMVTARAY